MTIPLEALKAVRTVISHGYPDGPCPDGISAAMLVKDVLPDAEIRFLAHNTKEHAELPARPAMMFVDIVPPAARVAAFVAAGAIVLDHHKSSRGLVELFKDKGVFGDEEAEPGVSGAVLAYRHVWSALIPFIPLQSRSASRSAWRACNGFWEDGRYEAQRVRAFAELAGVRDTWQTKDERWRKATIQAKVIRFFSPEEWLDGDPLNEKRLNTRLETLGETLMRRDEEHSRSLIASAFRFSNAHGVRVVVLPSTLISDAAEALRGEADVVVGFAYRVEKNDPQLRLSFRSRGAFDVSNIAKRLGGGGHTNAAGCALAADPVATGPSNPYTLVREIFAPFGPDGSFSPEGGSK